MPLSYVRCRKSSGCCCKEGRSQAKILEGFHNYGALKDDSYLASLFPTPTPPSFQEKKKKPFKFNGWNLGTLEYSQAKTNSWHPKNGGTPLVPRGIPKTWKTIIQLSAENFWGCKGRKGSEKSEIHIKLLYHVKVVNLSAKLLLGWGKPAPEGCLFSFLKKHGTVERKGEKETTGVPIFNHLVELIGMEYIIIQQKTQHMPPCQFLLLFYLLEMCSIWNVFGDDSM